MTDQPTKTRPGDQPLPTAGRECVQDALITLIEERKQLGVERYGSPLMTHNGRDAGRDAVEEALDLTVYSMQVAMELRDLRAAVERVRALVDDGPLSGAAVSGEWEGGWNSAMEAIQKTLDKVASVPPSQTDDAPTTPATTWTPGPVAVAEAVEWARQAGKASATIEALTANAGCERHPNAGSIGPYCMACTIIPAPAPAPAADPSAYEERERTGRNAGLVLPEQAPAVDEDTLRSARRDSLLVLLSRVRRGRVAITPDEGALLQQHVETEISEASAARDERKRLGLMVDEYSAGARHLSDLLRTEKGRADAAIERETVLEGEIEAQHAAIERVRALRAPIAEALEQADYRRDMRRGDLADSIMPVILAALDGTEQPATKQNRGGCCDCPHEMEA